MNLTRRYSKAFTLVELLAVVAIIGILIGGLGLILRDNNPGPGLRAAQSTLMSALSIARGQAALNQGDAMLLVQAAKAQPNFLRSIRVVFKNSSGNWQMAGNEIILPQGIYVVPTAAGVDGATASGAHFSTFFTGSGPVNIVGSDKTTTIVSGTFLQSGQISPLGNLDGSAGGYVLVAAGTPTSANAVTLDNSIAIRGFFVSNYGVATLINDSASFPN